MVTGTQMKAMGFGFITWMRSNWFRISLLSVKRNWALLHSPRQSQYRTNSKPTSNLLSKCPQPQHLENNTSIVTYMLFLQTHICHIWRASSLDDIFFSLKDNSLSGTYVWLCITLHIESIHQSKLHYYSVLKSHNFLNILINILLHFWVHEGKYVSISLNREQHGSWLSEATGLFQNKSNKSTMVYKKDWLFSLV